MKQSAAEQQQVFNNNNNNKNLYKFKTSEVKLFFKFSIAHNTAKQALTEKRIYELK